MRKAEDILMPFNIENPNNGKLTNDFPIKICDTTVMLSQATIKKAAI
jgi:hypothetical protein